jgi:sugar/nucleoside kinase (ribokinase family)
MLQIPGATSYIGCIGKDKFGEEMKKNAQAAGVNVSCKAPFLFFFLLHDTSPHCTTSYYNPTIYATRPIIMRMRMLQRAHVLPVLLVEKGKLVTVSSLQQACLNFNQFP